MTSKLIKQTELNSNLPFKLIVLSKITVFKLNIKYFIMSIFIFFRAHINTLQNWVKGNFKLGFKQSHKRVKMEVDFAAKGEKLLGDFLFKTKHCRAYQLSLLKSLLDDNSTTEYGKKHEFDKIQTLEGFRNNVPVNTYNELEPYINKHINGMEDVLIKGRAVYYATTSGSTGNPKFIPTTEQTLKSSHEGSARIWSYSLHKNKVGAFDGKMLVIVSPAIEGYLQDGTPYGSTSGQYIKNLNESLRQKYVVPYDVFEIKDYEAKYYAILLLGITEQNTTMLSSANPSTLLVLAKKANEFKKSLINDIRHGTLNMELKIESKLRKLIESKIYPNPERADALEQFIAKDPGGILKPRHYWDKLAVITCWTGGNCNVYLEKMKLWYGDVALKDLGYLASEIRGSIPLKINSPDGVLTIDENFFEFLPVSGKENTLDKYLLADELLEGQQYYVFFSNRSGLYRYDINDIIEVTGFVGDTPTIKFIQKGKGVTNITGEKLYEQQVIQAINKVESELKVPTVFYHMQAKLKESYYQIYCEFEDQNLSKYKLQTFLSALDRQLGVVNLEYNAKRSSLRLHHLELHVLDEGSFEKFKKHRVKQGVREGQFKAEILSTEQDRVSVLSVKSVIKECTNQTNLNEVV